MTTDHLSVIVPLLNEELLLPRLLDNLASQQGCIFDVVLCDAGSTDATRDVAKQLAEALPFPVMLIDAPRGRGTQMNVGARSSRGEWLLFLHVDSSFEDPQALSLALATMQRERRLSSGRVAGHFPIRFARTTPTAAFAYFFYEAKSRLDLAGCVHGDQGMLMHRSVYERLGGFNEDLPFLEDEYMAASVREHGGWLLLPSVLITSARRFEAEGLYNRQTLNALIQNFLHLGWKRFFDVLPGLYRAQHQTGRLRLLPFWRKIRELFARETLPWRVHLWYATGSFVRSQAWQLLYAAHCRRQYLRGLPATLTGSEITARMRGFERVFANPLGDVLSAVIVWFWFHMTYLYLVLLKK